MRVGLIGYGYWGPNLARNLIEAGFSLAHIADRDSDRLALAKRRHPQVWITQNEREVTRASDLDAVAIATPLSTHYDLALDALMDGKHVLVTKPLAQDSRQASRLTAIAEDAGLTLLTDHTFLFTGAVRNLAATDLGRIHYFSSTRVNLGLFQQDCDVIWDLAPHDFSIMLYALASKPTRIRALGGDFAGSGQANAAWISCSWPAGTQAHIAVSWLSPVKLRQTLIVGDERMAVYDDLEPSEKVRIYDAGVSLERSRERAHGLMVAYRKGDVYAPALDTREALRVECDHFRDCIEHKTPVIGGQLAIEVVALCEAASQSLANDGAPVDL